MYNKLNMSATGCTTLASAPQARHAISVPSYALTAPQHTLTLLLLLSSSRLAGLRSPCTTLWWCR